MIYCLRLFAPYFAIAILLFSPLCATAQQTAHSENTQKNASWLAIADDQIIASFGSFIVHFLGTTHLFGNLHFGSITTPTATPCPYGSAYPDGCAGAPPTPASSFSYTYQNPRFFNPGYALTTYNLVVPGWTNSSLQSSAGYTPAHPPQWNVAGVDYPVGIDTSQYGLPTSAHGVLLDPTANAPCPRGPCGIPYQVSGTGTHIPCSVVTYSGTAYGEPSSGGVLLKKINCTTPASGILDIEGYDFSGASSGLSTGIGLYVNSSQTGPCIIANDAFTNASGGGAIASNSEPAFITGCSLLVFRNNYVNNQADTFYSGKLNGWLIASSPSTTIEYNYFTKMLSRPILGPGCSATVSNSLTVQFNVFEGIHYAPNGSQHPDTLEQSCTGTSSTSPAAIFNWNYNTELQGGPNGGIQDEALVLPFITSENTTGSANATIDNNTLISNASAVVVYGYILASSPTIFNVTSFSDSAPNGGPVNSAQTIFDQNGHNDGQVTTQVADGFEGQYVATSSDNIHRYYAGNTAQLDTFVGETSGAKVQGILSTNTLNAVGSSGNYYFTVVYGDPTTPLIPGEYINDQTYGFGIVPLGSSGQGAQLASSFSTCSGCSNNGGRGAYTLSKSATPCGSAISPCAFTLIDSTASVGIDFDGRLGEPSCSGPASTCFGFQNTNVNNNFIDPSGLAHCIGAGQLYWDNAGTLMTGPQTFSGNVLMPQNALIALSSFPANGDNSLQCSGFFFP